MPEASMSAGAVAGIMTAGFLLYLAMLSIFLLGPPKRSKSPVQSLGVKNSDANTTLNPLEIDGEECSITMEAFYDFQPDQPDELFLSIGDRILVSKKYPDGWAMGINLSSDKEGMFPLACAGPLNARRPLPLQVARNKTHFSSRKQSIKR